MILTEDQVKKLWRKEYSRWGFEARREREKTRALANRIVLLLGPDAKEGGEV